MSSLICCFTNACFADKTDGVPNFVAKFLEIPEENLSIVNQYFNGFESLSDFKGCYIVPQNHMGSSTHELSRDNVKFGSSAHKAYIYGTNPVTVGVNTNHRAYPSFKFSNTPMGIIKGAALVEFWVWSNIKLSDSPEKNWFSLATFSNYNDINWYRSYLVNINAHYIMHLMHVPNNTEDIHDIFQTTSLHFPLNQWVKVSIYIDNDSDNKFHSPFLAVWQDGELVSAARFNPRLSLDVDLTKHIGFTLPKCLKGITTNSPVSEAEAACGLDYTGGLAQAHFGLYAAPRLSTGVIYNDDLSVSTIKVLH